MINWIFLKRVLPCCRLPSCNLQISPLEYIIIFLVEFGRFNKKVVTLRSTGCEVPLMTSDDESDRKGNENQNAFSVFEISGGWLN